MIHHNRIPPHDDDRDPFDNPEAIYDIGAESESPLVQDEPSEESVIPYDDPLAAIDRELIAAGHLEAPDISDAIEEEPEDGIDPELSEKSLEQFAADLRQTWHKLGLRDYRYVTRERLRDLDPRALLLLDAHTAELLYFDTAKKVWERLGSEPVCAELLLRQLDPPDDPAHPAVGIDLVQLRSDSRDKAEKYLGEELGVDKGQLRAMKLGGPNQQHDVIRLAYVLSEEPALKKFRELYESEVFSRVEPLDLVVLAKSIKNEIKNYIFNYKEALRNRATDKKGPTMDYIEHLQYDRAMHSAEASLYLIEEVLGGLGIGKTKPGRKTK